MLLKKTKTLTKDEVKKELSLINSKKIASGMIIGIGGIGILKYSPLVDNYVSSLIESIKSCLLSSTWFLGVAIPQYFIVLIYLLIIVTVLQQTLANNKESAKK